MFSRACHHNHSYHKCYPRIIDININLKLSASSNDPPCRSAVLAQQELLRLVESNPDGLETMDPIKDFNIRDIDTVDLISRKSYLDDVIDKYVCTGCPKLQEHVSGSFTLIFLFTDSCRKFIC